MLLFGFSTDGWSLADWTGLGIFLLALCGMIATNWRLVIRLKDEVTGLVKQFSERNARSDKIHEQLADDIRENGRQIKETNDGLAKAILETTHNVNKVVLNQIEKLADQKERLIRVEGLLEGSRQDRDIIHKSLDRIEEQVNKP